MLMVAIIAAVFAAVGPAQALTIATFADPTVSGPVEYMFEVQDGAPGTISEPLGAPLVDLYINETLLIAPPPGGLYEDVDLQFDPLNYTGSFLTGATVGQGYFEFVKNQQVLLRIDFDSAYLGRSTVGGDNIFSTNNVQFTVMGTPLPMDAASFAFSFTNQTPHVGAAPAFDATASFTSSGVPEPLTVALLAVAMGLAIKRRRC